MHKLIQKYWWVIAIIIFLVVTSYTPDKKNSMFGSNGFGCSSNNKLGEVCNYTKDCSSGLSCVARATCNINCNEYNQCECTTQKLCEKIIDAGHIDSLGRYELVSASYGSFYNYMEN